MLELNYEISALTNRHIVEVLFIWFYSCRTLLLNTVHLDCLSSWPAIFRSDC